MAKKPPAVAPAVVDIRQELAVLRSTAAPVIYFDGYTTSGTYGGIGNITVICGLHTVVDGRNVNENRDVAHLRFPVSAIPALRRALDHIEDSLKPVPDVLKN